MGELSGEKQNEKGVVHVTDGAGRFMSCIQFRLDEQKIKYMSETSYVGDKNIS
jgi:hypothetical protein